MGGGDQPGGIEQRKERLRLVGRDNLERHADLVGDPLDAPELVDPVAGGREPKRARLVVGDVERAVQVDAAPQQRHEVVAPRVLGAKAGRVPRRTLRELVLLEQDDVVCAESREVVGETAAGNAAADDRDPRLLQHGRDASESSQPGRRP